MKGRMARFTGAAALAATVGLTGFSPPAAAATAAAPNCAQPVAPADVVTELPWSQRRFPTDRLSVVADGRGVTVAVIDSGVDNLHPQLAHRVRTGTDFLDPGKDGTNDCDGHGTAVASIIAAERVDGVQFRGLAPRASILPVRITEQELVDGELSGRTVSAAAFGRAIRWAVDHGADVLNLSVVIYADERPVREAIAYAVEKDVVVVAAAGNLHDKGDPIPYPASYSGVIGVGAIGPTGQWEKFSQVGQYVDVVAPGSDVLGAVPGRGHESGTGTSYATPFVAATAALVRQRFPGLTARQVIYRIIATVDPAPGGDRDDTYGYGVVNPYRAATETVAAGEPFKPAALVQRSADPSTALAQARQDHARRRALRLAGVGAAAATLIVTMALVLPRGARRRWRPAGFADPVMDEPR